MRFIPKDFSLLWGNLARRLLRTDGWVCVGVCLCRAYVLGLRPRGALAGRGPLALIGRGVAWPQGCRGGRGGSAG